MFSQQRILYCNCFKPSYKNVTFALRTYRTIPLERVELEKFRRNTLLDKVAPDNVAAVVLHFQLVDNR